MSAPVRALPSPPGTVVQYHDGRLYLVLGNDELWRSDGSAAGTYALAEAPVDSGPFPVRSFGLRVFSGSHLFMVAPDGPFGRELWAIDLDGSTPPCGGDCNWDSVVDLAEVLTLKEIALRGSTTNACSLGDADSNATITIDELVAAVSSLIGACGVDGE